MMREPSAQDPAPARPGAAEGEQALEPAESVSQGAEGIEAGSVADLPALPETGNDVVDGVLARLEGLADRPVGEHVAIFEQAHDELRRALDGAGQD